MIRTITHLHIFLLATARAFVLSHAQKFYEIEELELTLANELKNNKNLDLK